MLDESRESLASDWLEKPPRIQKKPLMLSASGTEPYLFLREPKGMSWEVPHGSGKMLGVPHRALSLLVFLCAQESEM